jgi:prepilin-type N-terminal cleavage/methylation domain-containing protein
MKVSSERGFTLPELVIVIVMLVLLLAVSLLFVRPKSYDNLDNDANRRLGLAALAQGVKEYHVETGGWPAGIPKGATPISNQPGGYDLCTSLVPGPLQDMTFDPVVGTAYIEKEGSDPQPTLDTCNTQGVTYITGYTIRKHDDSVTFSAPAAATGALEITVR